MKRLLILFSIILSITLISFYALFFYANSPSFLLKLTTLIGEKTNINCSAKSHSISLSGKISVNELKILDDSNEKTILNIPQAEIKISWLKLLNPNYLPQYISLPNINLAIDIKNGKTGIKILDEQLKLPDFVTVSTNIQSITVHKISPLDIQIQNSSISEKTNNSAIKIGDLRFKALLTRSQNKIDFKPNFISINNLESTISSSSFVITKLLDKKNKIPSNLSLQFNAEELRSSFNLDNYNTESYAKNILIHEPTANTKLLFKEMSCSSEKKVITLHSQAVEAAAFSASPILQYLLKEKNIPQNINATFNVDKFSIKSDLKDFALEIAPITITDNQKTSLKIDKFTLDANFNLLNTFTLNKIKLANINANIHSSSPILLSMAKNNKISLPKDYNLNLKLNSIDTAIKPNLDVNLSNLEISDAIGTQISAKQTSINVENDQISASINSLNSIIDTKNPLLISLNLPKTLINSKIDNLKLIQKNNTSNIIVNDLLVTNENLAIKANNIKTTLNAKNNYSPLNASINNLFVSAQVNNPLIRYIDTKQQLNLNNYFTNFELNSMDLNVVIDAKSNEKSSLKFTALTIDQYPQIRNFSFVGQIKEPYTSIDQIALDVFDGNIAVNGIVRYKNKIGYELNMKSRNIDLQQVLQLYKERKFDLSGKIDIDVNASSNNLKPQKIDGSIVATSTISIEQDSIKKILEILKIPGQNELNFTSAEINLNLLNNVLSFNKVELMNDKFISILANESQLSLDENLKPQTFFAPIKIRTPYSILKWRDYLIDDGKTVEIPISLAGPVDNIQSIAITAVAQTVLNYTIKSKLFKSDKNTSSEESNTKPKPSKEEKIKNTIKDVLNLFGK